MRIALKVVAVFAVVLLLVGLGRGTRSVVPALVDQDYALALSTADQFLCAWVTRDQEKGLALLSSELKKSRGEEELRRYIAGLSNPHHVSFELGPGARRPDGRFSFEVRVYDHYTGSRWGHARPEARHIVLERVAAEDWRVDELP